MSDNEKRKYAKIICGIIVFAMIGGILYLTFQTPEQTTKLSETVRLWLKDRGWEMDSKVIRSIAHIPMFFFLGLAVFLFGYVIKWKWYVILSIAISFSLLDEVIKVIIPTREFDFKDFLMNLIGFFSAGLFFLLFRWLKNKWNNQRKLNNSIKEKQ